MSFIRAIPTQWSRFRARSCRIHTPSPASSVPTVKSQFLTSFVRVAAGFGFAAALSGAAAETPPSARAPNILVILADDLGYADIGCNGGKVIPTPHIDRLAQSGVRFDAGYVTHPYCSPSRAGLLTGRYQQRFGHECNPDSATATNNVGLPVTETLLPAVLKTAGYATGLVGKWHLGIAPQFHPRNRGFDEFYGFLSGNISYYGQPTPRSGPIYRDFDPVDPATITYLTDTFADEANAFIHRHRDQPWFLYLAFNAPHSPDQATPNYLARFPHLSEPQKTYAAMVSALDDGVGRVITELARLGLEKNTLVFFLSDNGGRHDGANNSPLRGYKGHTFEGGVRVPFLASWPGKIPADTVLHQPISALDIFPTALALAGITGAPAARAEGVNLIPHLTGQMTKLAPRTLYWRVQGGWDFAVRDGDDKLVKPGWRDESELFDLRADKSESKNLAHQNTATAARLRALYDEWNRRNVAPLWDDPHRTATMRQRAEILQKTGIPGGDPPPNL